MTRHYFISIFERCW